MSTTSTDADLDLRTVRYFVAVVEHGNFRRAAAELHITQPSLSRQIRRLESQLGVRLIDRATTAPSTATEAGRAFLARAHALLRDASDAVTTARAAGRPGRLVVGYLSTVIVTPAVLDLRRRHPQVDVEPRHLRFDEPRPALLDRRVDVALTRLPVPSTSGLEVSVLYAEQRAVLVSSSHALARRSWLTLDDIADEPLPRVGDPAWNAFWRIDPRPDGTRPPAGPVVTSIEDKLEMVACGQIVAITAAHHVGLRPDVVEIPLVGVAPCEVAMLTRAGDRRPLVEEFRRSAEALRARA